MAKKSQLVPGLSRRYSQGVRRFSSASEDLEKAKARLSVLTEDPGNDVKLKLYGLYKQVHRAHLGVGGWVLCSVEPTAVSLPPSFTQATLGRCTTKQPGMLDMVGRAKWNAWNSLGDLSQVRELMGSVTVCFPLNCVNYIALLGSDVVPIQKYKTSSLQM